MKKLIAYQFIMTAIVLSVFFVVLNLTGDAAFAAFAAAVTSFAAAAAVTSFAAAAAFAAVAAAFAAAAAFVAAAAAFVVVATVAADELKLDKTAVISSYIIQFIVILVPMLIVILK